MEDVSAAQSGEGTKRNDYDGTIKAYLEHFTDAEMVGLINGAFLADYPLYSEVIRLRTESNISMELKTHDKRTSDYLISVNGDLFHFEYQTSEDKQIAFRLFEYGFRAAVSHGRTDIENSVIMRLPGSVVIYLRDTEDTPKEVEVTLQLPNDFQVNYENHTLTYKIPTLRERDYSAAQMSERSLSIMLPFYISNEPDKATDEKLPELAEDYRETHSAILKMYSEKKLSLSVTQAMLENLRTSTYEIIDKSKITDKEGAKNLMAAMEAQANTVYSAFSVDYFADFDRAKRIEKELEQERQRAEQEQKRAEQTQKTFLKAIAKSIARGDIIYDICDRFDITEDELKNLSDGNKDIIAAMRAEIAAKKNK
ncbi:hypothetical protein FACS1894188_10850 [Clostridia bacterium]|nr:hypothetical protein FACS1894188_10850 [Clostridia bacterium]